MLILLLGFKNHETHEIHENFFSRVEHVEGRVVGEVSWSWRVECSF